MKIYLIFLFATLIIANEEGNSGRIYSNEGPNEQSWDNNEDSTYAKTSASSTKRFKEVDDAELRKLEPLGGSVTVVARGKKDETVLVMSSDFLSYIDAQYINGVLSNSTYKIRFTFPEDGNYTIKLEFNEKLTTCSFMFCDCSSIISIDFTEFDSSEVTSMSIMFNSCTQLESINFTNFDN